MEKCIPIMVINWNGLEDTKACVDSLIQQDYQKTTIYLLDNASQNQEFEALKSLYSREEKVKLYYSDQNLGFCKGSIYLFDQIQKDGIDYDFLGMLNNDAKATKNWLSILTEFAIKENVDAASCKMIRFDDHNTLDTVGHLLLNTGEIIPIAHGANVEDYCKTIDHWGPCGGACLYRKTMIDDIGFFDPYFDTGYEDAEYGLRAVLCGYKSSYCPDAMVYHKVSQSLNKVIDTEYLIRIQENIFYSYFKLMPTSFLILNMPFMFIKYLAVLSIDIISFRKRFLHIMWSAIKRSFTINKSLFKTTRKSFQEDRKLISPWTIFNKSTFFLWFDIKRLYHLVMKGERSKFDT